MPRSAAAFLIFFALGCNREIDEHTHPFVEHEHNHSHEHSHELLQHTHEHQHPFADHMHADETADAVIVSIDPPSPSAPWSIAVTA